MMSNRETGQERKSDFGHHCEGLCVVFNAWEGVKQQCHDLCRTRSLAAVTLSSRTASNVPIYKEMKTDIMCIYELL
jgi:hypothetical protein